MKWKILRQGKKAPISLYWASSSDQMDEGFVDPRKLINMSPEN